MIICRNIFKSYGVKHVLKNLCLEVPENFTVSIVGRSGCGKTTLLNIISGILSPDSGDVIFNGENITNKPGLISYMMQKDLLFDHLTVLENVSLPLVIQGQGKKFARQKVFDLFNLFDLDNIQHLYPHQLSGGMRQRAALLRTYVNSNGTMLLDEPFSSLDESTRVKIREWFFSITKKFNLTTLLITHDICEAIELSDEIYVLTESLGSVIKVNKPFDKNLILSMMR